MQVVVQKTVWLRTAGRLFLQKPFNAATHYHYSTESSHQQTDNGNTTLSSEQIATLHRMLRVNQAGEIGANYIYKGQMAAFRNNQELRPLIQHMWDQEKVHLQVFDSILAQNGTRPSALRPLWEVAGYTIGYLTAACGKETAMACTEAVETVIGQHYNE
jgi:3-demethoxyubiquinol 3-hydroxylase